MKQVIYTLTAQEQADLIAVVKDTYKKLQDSYAKNAKRYNNQTRQGLENVWLETAKAKAIFQQLDKDGIAHITQERDEHYTFADHAGDMFDPEVNDDVDPEELKTQRRRELARFNRAGVWYHTLYVLGEEIDSIGGCVGKDFYGSGYDTDFYATALQQVEKQLPDFYADVIAAASLI